MWRRLGAEFSGTFWLRFAGCGSAVFARFRATDVLPYILTQVAGAIAAAATRTVDEGDALSNLTRASK